MPDIEERYCRWREAKQGYAKYASGFRRSDVISAMSILCAAHAHASMKDNAHASI